VIESPLGSWRGLAPRERRLIVLAALVIGLAVIVLTLVDPAWQGRRKLQQELPVLRAQIAQLDALGQQARSLQSAPPVTDSPSALKTQLEASLSAARLRSSLTQMTTASDTLELKFNNVAFAQWWPWLEAALRETRLRVVDASITREPTVGLVAVRLVLEVPAREATK
jgi:general secretion pathway protein M